jgi:hypothetical protein
MIVHQVGGQQLPLDADIRADKRALRIADVVQDPKGS